MKIDNLRKYVELRNSLMREKQELESRLGEINNALGDEGPRTTASPEARPVAASGAPARSTAGRAAGGRRARRGSAGGGLSLREAVLQLTSERPMTKEDILNGVKQLGYKFTTNNPLNSLGVILYGRNPRFKNEQGRFSPSGPMSGGGGGRGGDGGGARRGGGVTRGGGGSPRRRQLSPEARERIAAAQRARWAKSRSGK